MVVLLVKVFSASSSSCLLAHGRVTPRRSGEALPESKQCIGCWLGSESALRPLVTYCVSVPSHTNPFFSARFKAGNRLKIGGHIFRRANNLKRLRKSGLVRSSRFLAPPKLACKSIADGTELKSQNEAHTVRNKASR